MKKKLARHNKLAHKVGKQQLLKPSYCCDVCDKVFSSKFQSLPEHYFRVHEQLETTYQCDDCIVSTKMKTHMVTHQRNVHLKLHPYFCDVCNFRKSSKTGIVQHISIVHLDMKDFTCKYCSKKYSSAQNLREHLKFGHHHVSRSSFDCFDCGRHFSSKNGMESHIYKNHYFMLPQCDQCSCYITEKTKFFAHWKSVHLQKKVVVKKSRILSSNPRKFACFDCNNSAAAYQSKISLFAHFTVHSAAYAKYVCDLCNIRLANRMVLVGHTAKCRG